MRYSIANKIGSVLLISQLALLTACNSSDKNSAPTITGLASPVVQENTLVVGSYTAADADDDQIAFSLSGTDSALFTINNAGQLSFINAPDFDNGETGPYSVTVIATDSSSNKLASELALTITVSDVVDTPSKAIVQTVAPDYSSSEVAFLDALNQQVANGYYVKNKSDYTISGYNNAIYHIGRYGIDTITKYQSSAPDTAVWSYSTQDNEDSTSRNPYAFVSASDKKAYILRYGSSKVWVVNPSATDASQFKIGELDLSAYVANDNTSNTPNPAAAVVTDGKLFIAMQRLSDAWAPNTAYVAVFDIATDSEIETNHLPDDNLKGIALAGLNPLGGSVVTANHKVYVTTRNSYSSTDVSLSKIEAVAVADYGLSEVLTAADLPNNTSSVIEQTAIVSADIGYFVANTTVFVPSYQVQSSLYQFNPTTGEVGTGDLAGSGSDNISAIALDKAGFLWISVINPALPGVDVLDTKTNTLFGTRLITELNPSAIQFLSN